MINFFNQNLKSDPKIIARIKDWVHEIMGIPDHVIVMVSELRCTKEDCPDVETVIAVLGEHNFARKHKLFKPAFEVTRSDIVSLAARGTHG